MIYVRIREGRDQHRAATRWLVDENRLLYIFAETEPVAVYNATDWVAVYAANED